MAYAGAGEDFRDHETRVDAHPVAVAIHRGPMRDAAANATVVELGGPAVPHVDVGWRIGGSFVTEYLAEEVRVDLTKKQVARNGAAWKVWAVTDDKPANSGEEGVVEARFHEGKVKSLRLSAG